MSSSLNEITSNLRYNLTKKFPSLKKSCQIAGKCPKLINVSGIQGEYLANFLKKDVMSEELLKECSDQKLASKWTALKYKEDALEAIPLMVVSFF